MELGKELKPTAIVLCLKEEGFKVSVRGVAYLLKRFKHTKSIHDAPRSGRPLSLSDANHSRIEALLSEDDEMTTTALLNKLREEGDSVSRSSVARARQRLGWTARSTRYCQLIRANNRLKRVEFCEMLLRTADTFENVIFTDETIVVLTSNTRKTYHKAGEARKFKPKPKYPVRVLIWGGISRRGATSAIIFTGIMDAERYIDILRRGLLPFIQSKFPDGDYRFQQDNDPKHTSRVARQFYADNDIKWWKTPAESPDLNPQERVWSHLKHFLSRNKQELVDGIQLFWRTKLTVFQCNQYINHIRKVIPKVIEKQGSAVVDDEV